MLTWYRLDRKPFLMEMLWQLTIKRIWKYLLEMIVIILRSLRVSYLRKQSSWGQHAAQLGPVGPRWAPCWPHEPCFRGAFYALFAEVEVIGSGDNQNRLLHRPSLLAIVLLVGVYGLRPNWLVLTFLWLVDNYGDVIIGEMAIQITSLTIIYSTVYSGADQRKHLSPVSLAFVRGIHRWPINSPHKGSVTREMFLFGDVIIDSNIDWGIPSLQIILADLPCIMDSRDRSEFLPFFVFKSHWQSRAQPYRQAASCCLGFARRL